ncbi:MAG: XTP/dITP diphosphatase [archaeon GB-1867-035]|nr:XTP/dITP diphosphatase [Candidatus Culexmicrobium profundum]
MFLSVDVSLELLFVTRNRHKFEEAFNILLPMGIKLKQAPIERIEVQSEDLSEIALIGAKNAVEVLKRPLVVEDAGLFIKSLNGFPGPYSSYVYKTIGVDGILKLMENVNDRSAYFKSAVAFCSPDGKCRVFVGEVHGEIAFEARGSGGFGFDPIFIPYESDGLTFAEMSISEKSLLSHRARAFREFGRWFIVEMK